MQIILMEKVANLGSLGDLVRVKDGYARNFLIPSGKAKRATPAALQDFEAKRAELERAANEKLATAQEFAARLEGVTVTVARKAGVDGRLFGSVTHYDIADGLKTLGFTVEKSDIRMPDGPLKMVGETALEVVLHTDVVATIKVAVVGEQQ
jgi:large subunit ribosomal protein L9